MAHSEFAIIERYFTELGTRREDVVLGVGDDAAILDPATAAGTACRTAARMLEDFADDCPGARRVAIELIDEASARLSAEGVEPRWATLALTLPRVDTDWLAAFAAGLDHAARDHRIALVGGDTTSGPPMAVVFVSGVAA